MGVKRLPLPTGSIPLVLPLEMVLVKGEYRVVGVVSQDELEALERDYEAGDIRAEETLKLIRTGKRP